MLEKIKDFCVSHTYGELDFNESHPWYCVFTIFVVIAAIVWTVVDLVWRCTWWAKKD